MSTTGVNMRSGSKSRILDDDIEE
uniref:Movement protein n=1 Tax=Heterorhabditis bacteriophora TaxID=37862 RepID=A0A1I7XLH4_HETBA